MHRSEWVLTQGMADVRKTEVIARRGYYENAVLGQTFEMVPPNGCLVGEDFSGWLEGSSKRNWAVDDRLKEKS